MPSPASGWPTGPPPAAATPPPPSTPPTRWRWPPSWMGASRGGGSLMLLVRCSTGIARGTSPPSRTLWNPMAGRAAAPPRPWTGGTPREEPHPRRAGRERARRHPAAAGHRRRAADRGHGPAPPDRDRRPRRPAAPPGRPPRGAGGHHRHDHAPRTRPLRDGQAGGHEGHRVLPRLRAPAVVDPAGRE